MSEEVPEGRCGFVLEPGDVGGEMAERNEARSNLWNMLHQVACCRRKVWSNSNTNRCIWHAEIDEKPVDELTEARADGPERLDSVYLRETDLNDAVSFENCEMRGADFGDAKLRDAEFTGANLQNADFVNVTLARANLADANLERADLQGSYLRDCKFSGANLYRAYLKDANLKGVDLAGLNIQFAVLEDTDIREVDLRGTNLRGAHLGEADLRGADLEDANLRSANLADTDFNRTNLDGTDLALANFEGADLSSADFNTANLRGAIFDQTNLTRSNLGGKDLRGINFVGADLTDADLTDANLRNAGLREATLEDAILTRTDLRGTDLGYAELYQTLFSDIRMNNRTEFGETCQYEARDTRPQNADTVTPLEAAAWTYRRIQTLHEENALAQDAREYHVRKAEAYRKLRWREFADVWSKPHRDPWNWLTTFVRATTYSANRWLSRHGESPHRVVGVSLLVILASAVLYPLIGGIKQPPTPDGQPTVIAFDLLPSIPIPLPGPIADLATSLYFSVVTFTTLGYGDLQPASGAAQALATVESFTGALLMALLVFVLGRRATW